MKSLAQQFFTSSINNFPQLKNLMKVLSKSVLNKQEKSSSNTSIFQTNSNLILNYPIQFINTAEKSNELKLKLYSSGNNKNNEGISGISQNKKIAIPKNNYLFLYPMQKTITSVSLHGMTSKSQQNKFFQKYNKLKQQVNSKESLDYLRILIQIYANYLISCQKQSKYKIKTTKQDIFQAQINFFGKYLYQQALQNYSQPYVDQKTINCIGSTHLKMIATAELKQTEKLFLNLQDSLVKNMNLEQFRMLHRLIRARSFNLYANSNQNTQNQQQKILIVAPLINYFSHSFSPNCKLTGLYLTHLRQSFLAVKTIKDIYYNQKLTLEFGQKMNNYEMFFKYGQIFDLNQDQKNKVPKINKNVNPYRQSYIFISYQKVPYVMMPPQFQQQTQQYKQQSKKYVDIQWKQSMLFQINQKLKNFIKIKPDGNINQKDYKALEILFTVKKQQYQNILLRNSLIKKRIYQFIVDQAKQNLKFIRKSIDDQKSMMDRDNEKQDSKQGRDSHIKIESNVFINQLQNQEIQNIQKFIQNASKKLK